MLDILKFNHQLRVPVAFDKVSAFNDIFFRDFPGRRLDRFFLTGGVFF